jgi:hypothetical protein
MKKVAFATLLWAAAFTPIFAGSVALAQTAGGDATKPAPPSASSAKPAPDAASPTTPGAGPSTPGTNPAAPGANPAPIRPGATRVTTPLPDPDKWESQKTATTAQRLFKCKPLACSDAETVTMVFSRSPTRHPDPQALDKLAKIDLPKSIRAADAAHEILTDGADKVDTLTSKTTTLKTYPAVLNESKFTRANVPIYLDTALIFAGPVLIRIQSVSKNRDLAQKSLNAFVDVMKIEEGPPLPPGASEPANPLPAISGKEEQL